MLLRALCEFAEQQRTAILPRMFEQRRIKWIVPLDSNGHFLGSLEPTCGKGSSANLGKSFVVPYVYRSANVKPRLLADTAEYVLGVVPNGGDPVSSVARHASFTREVSNCALATGKPNIFAVEGFLRSWVLSEHNLPATLVSTDQVTFRVDGYYPIEDPEILLYWNRVSGFSRSGPETQFCSICGKPADDKKQRHFKIRGLPGGRTTGAALISANIRSAESYGLEASAGVPTCWQCEESATRAINHLLSNPSNRIRYRDTTFIFWSKHDYPFNLGSMLLYPQSSEVKILESCALSGQPAADHFDPDPFHVAALSANGGRAVVRDWIGISLAELKKNLSRYFRLQRLIGPDGRLAQPLGIMDLLVDERDPRSSYPGAELEALMRLALGGGPLPIATLAACLLRNRVENRVTYPRAVLTKMVLLSQHPFPRDKDMVTLDPEENRPAYICGRLLALMERLQWVALGPTNASVVDHFFSTASVVPRFAFPHLVRLAQPHLRKIRARNPGLFLLMQREMTELMEKLQHFPASLSLIDQGLFALGYYHQRAFASRRVAEHLENGNEEDPRSSALQGDVYV